MHHECVKSINLVLTAAGTAVNTDTGLGSVIASGVQSALSAVGATAEDRLTGQIIGTDPAGGTAVEAMESTPGDTISNNLSTHIKNVFLNSAGTWNVDNTGNLTASGTIVLKWTRM